MVSRSDVDDTYQRIKHLKIHRVIIQNGKLIEPTLRNSLQSPRLFKLACFFRQILPFVSIPNLSFLICLEDLLQEAPILQSVKIPFFVIAKPKINPQGCLFPHTEWMAYWELIHHQLNRMERKIPWEQRKKELFWRGATSGYGYHKQQAPRPKIVQAAQNFPEDMNVYFSAVVQNNRLSDMDRYMRPTLPPWKQVAYRYLLALDGNSFPSSFQWQLGSGSLVFKQTSPYDEWYYPSLQPFVHFIPVEPDGSDLMEKKQWADDHEEAGRQIAQNGKRFADTHLSPEGIIRYAVSTLQKYALHMSPS